MPRLLALRLLGCVALAALALARWLAAPGGRLPGFDNVDLWDTVMLRGAVGEWLRTGEGWRSTAVFFPVGYPILELTPNLLDHLTGALLDALLPFPVSDGLWWLLVLSLNALAGHALGRHLGGSEGAGWLGAVAFGLSEPILREANLHHAPQAMAFFGPAYLLALLRLREAPGVGRAVLAGALLAGSALAYWYQGLFFGLAGLFLLSGIPPARLLLVGLSCALLCLPALWPYLSTWGEIPLTAGAEPPPAVEMPPGIAALGAKEGFVAWHGADPLFPFQATPMDLSNRVSLALVLAAALGWRRGARRAFAGIALLGGLMVLGPVLLWEGEPVLLAGETIPLPFAALRALHPVLERLTWPERFGVLIPLGLIGLAARAPRPGLFALAVLAETLLLSRNLPLQAVDLEGRRCHAELRGGGEGAVVELPLRRPGLQAQRAGVHRRFHGRASVNPILLPPGARPPEAFERWRSERVLLRALERLDGAALDSVRAEDLAALRQDGVRFVVLDAEPGVLWSAAELRRARRALESVVGGARDLGCAVVFDLNGPPDSRDDGAAQGEEWRQRRWREVQERGVPELPTRIRPSRPRGGYDDGPAPSPGRDNETKPDLPTSP